MSEYIEIPDELPESWPTEWKGNTTIKCGDRGYQLKILTDGHPSRVHLENYKRILHRWDELWPQAFKIISRMVADYGYDYKLIEDSVNFPMLDMMIPNQPITDGVSWNIGAKFYEGHGQWHVCFDGWSATEVGSQPYF